MEKTWVFKLTSGRYLHGEFDSWHYRTTSSLKAAYKISGTEEYANGVAFILSKIFNESFEVSKVSGTKI